MKVLLFLIVLSCLFLGLQAQVNCPKQCDCPTTFQPVCGVSKKTHANKCLAECFGDKIAHAGSCKSTCSDFNGRKKRTHCSFIKLGKYGVRSRCCISKYSCKKGKKCRKTGKHCKLVGQSKFTYPKSKCTWIKGKKTSRRHCCFFVRTCVGSKCTETQKHCEFIGKSYVKTVNGCFWKKVLGGRQEWCCKRVKNLNCAAGSVCKKFTQTCLANTKVVTQKLVNKCHWAKLSHGCKRKQCCVSKITCEDKICKSKRRSCSFTGPVICHKSHKKCAFKKTSPTCKRLQCCSSIKKCVGKKCSQTGSKCAFKGPSICTTRHRRCSFKKRSNKSSQLRCCMSVRQCKGKTCQTFARPCSWVGKRVVKVFVNGCKWKVLGPHSKRKICCKTEKGCKGKVCQVKSKKCTFKGPKITEKQIMKCAWVKYGQYGMRKRCCTSLKRCGTKCKLLNKKCSHVGEVISRKNHKKCSLKRVRGGKRMQCCNWVRYCYGNTCKKINKKCTFTSALMKTTRKCSCKWTQRRNHKQRRCCCINKQCRDKKCKILKKSCKWTGKRLSKKVKSGCSWAVYEKTGRRKKCCKKSLKCIDKKCKVVSNKCTWFGPIIKTSIFNRCTLSNVSKNRVQKQCCKIMRHCYANKCKNTKLKCTKVGPSISKRGVSKCQMRKSRGGLRKLCCSMIKTCKGKICKMSHKKCKFVGATQKTTRKCACKSTKRKGGRQNRCCCVSRVCKGIYCKNLKTKCHWTGILVSSKVSHGCQTKIFGKHGSRQYCCKSKTQCHGKFCRLVKKTCHWKGQITRKLIKRKCTNIRKRNGFIRRCCNISTLCIGKHCEKKKRDCQVVKKISRKSKTNCVVVTFKNGHCKKTRCCTLTKSCLNKKCKISKKKCVWRGTPTCTRSSCKCQWAQKTKTCKQRKCSCSKRVCHAKKCVSSITKTYFSGKKLCAHQGRKCDWVTVGKTGRRKQCCVSTKKCKTCKAEKVCKFVGPIVTSTTKLKCSYRKVAKNQARKRCCRITRTCRDKTCTQTSKCKFTGKIIKNGCIYKKKKVCFKAKLGKGGLYCLVRGDPHFVSFKKERFNHLVNGPQILAQTSTFEVQAFRSKWARSSVTTRIAVTVGKKIKTHVETINANRYLVNGQHIFLKNKAAHITKNLIIRRLSKSKTLIKTKSGNFVHLKFHNRRNTQGKRFWYQSQFIHTKIRLGKIDKATGLCVDRTKGKGPTIFVGKKDQKFTKCQRNHARNVCKHRRVPKNNLSRCIKKYLNTTSNPPCEKRNVCKGKKCQGKRNCKGKLCVKCSGKGCIKKTPTLPKCVGKKCKNNKCLNKNCTVCLGPGCVHPKPKCFGVKCNKPKKVPKKLSHFCRASGDPHFTAFNGKTYDNYRVGDVIFVQSPKFIVHTRQSQWGGAAVHTKFVVQANEKGDKFQVNSRATQKLNGKKISLTVGQVVEAPNGGSIKRVSEAEFKVTGVDGSYIDARINEGNGWPQKHYIDIIAFLKSTKGLTGLCVSKDQFLAAKGLFSKFKEQKVLKKVRLNPKKLQDSEKQCKKYGVNKKNLKACASDIILSGGKLTPTNFVKILKLKKRDEVNYKEVKKAQKIIRKSEVQEKRGHHFCRASGDPHFTSFKGIRYDNYKTGDLVYVHQPEFTVHTRQASWGSAAVNVKIVVQTNSKGDKIEIDSRSKQIVDGESISLQVGDSKTTKNGGKITRKSVSEFQITGVDGSYVDTIINEGQGWAQPHYMDLVIFSPVIKGVTGLCVENKSIPAKGLFHEEQPIVILQKKKITKVERETGIKTCKEAGVNKRNLRQCSTDLIRSDNKITPKACLVIFNLKKKDEIKYIKAVEAKKIESLVKAQNKVGNHFCRASGDPHFSSFTGKTYNNYQVGDFVMVSGPQFEVHTTQSKWGGASVHTKFIVRTNEKGDKIAVHSREEQVINGVEVSLKIGETRTVPNGGSIKRTSKSRFLVNGVDGSYVDAIVNEGNGWPQKHYIDIVVYVKSIEGLTGLCVSSDQVFAAKGLFTTTTPPQKLEKPVITKEQRNDATDKCKSYGIDKKNLRSCATDLVRSGGMISPRSFVQITKLKASLEVKYMDKKLGKATKPKRK